MAREVPANRPNPIARFAESVPALRAHGVARGARLLAVITALFIAVTQSYDGTQVFALALAVVLLATVAPAPPRVAQFIRSIGGGIAFFAGAILLSQGAGILLLLLGLLATLAQGIAGYHAGRLSSVVAGFFAAAPVTGGLVALIVLAVE